MIDTIKIGHSYRRMPDIKDLTTCGWHKDERAIKSKSWFYKEKGSSPYLFLFTAPDGIVYLSARVSLPAFLFGSNVRLPNQEEITLGLIKLSEFVTEKSGLEFDAQTAIVWETHFTKDYLIGECAMRQVISKLALMNIPRFEKGGYSETTLYFHSKGKGKKENRPKTICIYDKQTERLDKSASASDIQQSKGLLRLEFRYKTTNAVKGLVKSLVLPDREAQTILTENVSSIVLAPIEKQILTLLESNDEQNALLLINERFSRRRTPKLIQFLIYQKSFGTDFYKIESLNFSKSAYYKCQKDLREVGVYSLDTEPKSMIQVNGFL